jgi:hypothetical protein
MGLMKKIGTVLSGKAKTVSMKSEETEINSNAPLAKYAMKSPVKKNK